MAKADSTLEKYDINTQADFIKETLSYLGATYKKSTVPHIKALFGSIFPKDVTCDFNGTLNPEINPMYQSLFKFNTQGVTLGEHIVPQLEHLLRSILYTYSRLKELGFTNFDGTMKIIEVEESLFIGDFLYFGFLCKQLSGTNIFLLDSSA